MRERGKSNTGRSVMLVNPGWGLETSSSILIDSLNDGPGKKKKKEEGWLSPGQKDAFCQNHG